MAGLKVRARRIALKMSLAELSRITGIDYTNLSRMERGERPIRLDHLRKISTALRCETGELLGKDLPDEGGVSVEPVPVLGAVEAGIWVDAMEWPEPDQYVIRVPREPRAKNPFALLVKGQSMNMEFPEGSHVICVDIHDFWRDVQTGDFVIVERRSHDQVEATVKELRFDASGQPWLWPRSTHPDHQLPIRLPQQEPHSGDGHNGASDVILRAVVIAAHKVLV